MKQRPARSLPAFGAFGLLGCVLLLATACGAKDKTYEATEVREIRDPGPPAPEASAAERFGANRGDPHGAMGGAGAPPPRVAWEATTPQGWEPLPPAQFRELGWRVAGNPDAMCTFSTAGGGLAMNVNRWRGQMGLEKLDDAAIAALPKKVLLGRPAVYVEMSGTYGGMGAQVLEGAKFVGLIAELPATSAFLKLTGPAAVVDAELPKFLALADTIRMSTGRAAPPGGAPPAPTGGGTEPAAASAPFRWTAPAGWKDQGEKPMRVVTFVPDAAPNSQVYVSILGGSAGGTRENIDRWRDQMGQPKLTDAEFAALSRAKVLGKEAVFVEVAGAFGGMEGGPGKAGSMLLGMVLERDDHSVFVKMVGPADEVAGERERFRAFCESFHE